MKKIIIILLLFPAPVLAQYQDSVYTFEIVSSLSPSVSYFGYPRYPGAAREPAVGYGGVLRAMWFPGRMLSVGIMTGYYFLVEDKISSIQGQNSPINATARLSAVPLQLAISMRQNNIELGLGMGPYIMMSTIDYGPPASGKRFELGLTFYGSYVFRMNSDIYIGPEFRILYLSYRRILSFMPSISFHFNLLRY